MNLNRPSISVGALTAADLDRGACGRHGRHLRRMPIVGRDTCTGGCETRAGCNCGTEACAVEGGIHADPVPSGTARRAAGLPLVLLVLLCWLPVLLVMALLRWL